MVAMDFSLARLKHLTWKMKLRAFLDGKEELTMAQAVSHKDCDLGKWLYADGLKRYSEIPEMHQLEKVHEELHATVKRIVEMKSSNNVELAEKEFSKIEKTSQDIISLLNIIEEKVNK